MSHDCSSCSLHSASAQMGLDVGNWDHLVCLAGNPNTGKSSVFNALTGLKQHTGNWPGKTVTRAEGGYKFNGRRYKLVDLPGTYSLLSASQDEEIARDFMLFGRPDCTVVVTDATCLERNLNLVLQVLEVSNKVVVCVNLMDEARRKGIDVDVRALSKELGVPVVATVARTGDGLQRLIATVADVIDGNVTTSPHHVESDGDCLRAVDELLQLIEKVAPGIPNARWVGMRLLDGDHRVRQALSRGDLDIAAGPDYDAHRGDDVETLLGRSDALQHTLARNFRDELVHSLYRDAESIAGRVVCKEGSRPRGLDERLDRIITSPIFGLPLMLILLGIVFWLTVSGANYPSAMLASGLFWLEARGAAAFDALGFPTWITGLVWHGTYRALAWVVAVMLPPMAIFFPCFTILEDLGYLPRVAFNLDWLFRRAGAHGKQALTMSMGFGCNAAGIIACRVIDSPRERLIAILTNNFVPCNGRFPTLIMLAMLLVSARMSPGLASAAAAGTVVMVVVVGVLVTLIVSSGLSRTVLRGEASAFTLELPPYRRPSIARILYTSLIDRTMFVLWRAVWVAMPAGAVIWIMGNVDVGGDSLASHFAGILDPLGHAIGLDGVILLAYVIAIPANEIVVPTMLMVYLGTGTMTEDISFDGLKELLFEKNGWTLLTAVNLMLFSLLHNPCATTIVTMWKETRSAKWTALGALMPLGIAFAVTFAVAQTVRLLG